MLQEAEEKHDSGEADAELLDLANQDWGQRLEEAVHDAKQKMHEQMCAHVEEVRLPRLPSCVRPPCCAAVRHGAL